MAAPLESVHTPQALHQHPQQEVCCWRFEPVVVLGREGTVVLTAKRLLFASQKHNNGGSSGRGEAGNSNANTPLRIAPALLQQQELQEQELHQQLAGEHQQAEASSQTPAGALVEAAAPTEVEAPAEDKQQQQGAGEPAHKSARQKAAAAKAHSVNAAAAAAKAAGAAAATAAAVAAAAAPRVELPSWEVLQKQQRQHEAEQLKQLQQQLLQQNPELLAVYKALVESPEGQPSEARDQQKGLSAEEFWRLHQHRLQALRPQPTPEAVSAAFLSRPPHYHLEGHQGGDALGSGELVVDCNEHMLSQILKEDPTIRAAHSSLVETGAASPAAALLVSRLPAAAPRKAVAVAVLSLDDSCNTLTAGLLSVACAFAGRMSADRFWGRVFRSKYFQSGIGLAERQQEVNEEEASAFVVSYLKEAVLMQLLQLILWQVFVSVARQRVSAQDALCLPGIEKTLLSDADLRIRGFGLADGLSSLAGDLAEKGPQAGFTASGAAAAAASSSLVGRFNRHSQRLLLQQLLQPAAAAAAAHDDAATRDKVGLVLLQERHLRSQAAAAAAAAGVPPADPNDAATLGCGVMAEEAPLLAALRLEELDEVSATKYQTLGVSRRQLYAAGARGPRSPAADAAAAVTGAAFAAANAADAQAAVGGQGARDPTDRLTRNQEAEAANAWLALQKSRTKARNSGALQSVRPLPADVEREPRESAVALARRPATKSQENTCFWIHAVAWTQAEEVAAAYETGRYMFVFNTKLCQKDKAAQVATLDYELTTVNAVRARQARVGELLRHFYSTTLPEDKKRTRLVQALDAIKAELENSQDFGGGFTGAATKALSAPLVEQITAARRHANRLQRLLQAAREKRATQQSRYAHQQQQITSATS
ncbi:hypothetical protein ACSSS7_004534 [Eimeria intestinalis]